MANSCKANICVVVPVKKTGTDLEKLLFRIDKSLNLSYKVLVMDLLSSPRMEKICKKLKNKLPVEYFNYAGRSLPFKSIFTYILKTIPRESGVITLSETQNYNGGAINTMARILQKKDIVTGSRFHKGATRREDKKFSNFLSYIVNRLFWLLFPIEEVRGYLSDFRMYKVKVIKEFKKSTGNLPFYRCGYTDDLEMFLKLAYFGVSVKEIELTCKGKKSGYFSDILKKTAGYIYLIFKLKVEKKIIKQQAPKKILHIVNIPWYSGLARFALDMGEVPENLKFGPVFGVVKNSVLYKKSVKKHTVIGLPGRGTLESLIGAAKLDVCLKRFNIKKIVAHTGSSFFIGTLISILTRRPIYRVYAQRGMISDNFLNRWMHKRSRGIIVPTWQLKTKFLQEGWDEEKVFYLPPVVRKRFSKSRIPDDNRVGIVGRLDKVKGHRILFQALGYIKDKLNNFELTVVGHEAGITWEELKQCAGKFGISDRVKYIGYIKEDKVPVFMKSCKLGIVPSLGSEAVSRVALEWMASGRPVLASAVGCLPEIIDSGKNGFLTSPGKYKLLGKKLHQILNNRQLNVKMAQNAIECVKKRHSPGVYEKNIGKILNE